MVHAKARVTSAASKLKGGTATGTKRKSDPEAAHERDGDHARARADVGSADAIRAAPRPGHAGAPQPATVPTCSPSAPTPAAASPPPALPVGTGVVEDVHGGRAPPYYYAPPYLALVEAPAAVGDLPFRPARAACLCGSFMHQYPRHARCRLNPRAAGLAPGEVAARTAALALARSSRAAATVRPHRVHVQACDRWGARGGSSAVAGDGCALVGGGAPRPVRTGSPEPAPAPTACLCGSLEHRRVRHAQCRLNPRAAGLTLAQVAERTAALGLARSSRHVDRMRDSRDRDRGRSAQGARVVLGVVGSGAVAGGGRGAPRPGRTGSPEQAPPPAACLCGSLEHRRIRHAQCRLNTRAAGLTLAQVAERTAALGLARSSRDVDRKRGGRDRGLYVRAVQTARVVPGVVAGDERLSITDELHRRGATHMRKRRLRVYVTDEQLRSRHRRTQASRLTTTNLQRALLASQQRRLRGRWGDAHRGRDAARKRRVRLVESDARRERRDECARDAVDPSVPPEGPRKADVWNVVRSRKRRRVRRNARRRDAYQYFRVHLRLQKLQGVRRDAGATFGRLLPCVRPLPSCVCCLVTLTSCGGRLAC